MCFKIQYEKQTTPPRVLESIFRLKFKFFVRREVSNRKFSNGRLQSFEREKNGKELNAQLKYIKLVC
jgi:hypothetical protein